MKTKLPIYSFAVYAITALIFIVGIFLCGLHYYYYNLPIKLKDFEAVITTGFGLNITFSFVGQIRETIKNEFILRMAPVRCNILDACQSIFNQDTAKDTKIQEIKEKLQLLENTHEYKMNSTHIMVIKICIFFSFFCFILLIFSAFFPASVIPAWLGILIAIFVPAPIIFSFLYFSYLSQDFEKKGQEMLNILNAFGALIKPVIKPVEPTQ